MMRVLMKRADEAADEVRERCKVLLQSSTAEACEGLARAIRAYDKAVATMLDVVSFNDREVRDHDAAFRFIDEHPRFNKTGSTVAHEALLGRGKLD